MDDGLGLIGDDGSGPAGSAAARGRRKAKAKAHAFEIVRPWPSLQRRCDPGGKPARSGTLATHCSLLLTSLLEHLHAREHHEAMATLALLMREFSRLAGTVAQAGLLLLRLSHGAELPERRVLFLRRVARFDTVHRHALLMELALEEAPPPPRLRLRLVLLLPCPHSRRCVATRRGAGNTRRRARCCSPSCPTAARSAASPRRRPPTRPRRRAPRRRARRQRRRQRRAPLGREGRGGGRLCGV